MKLAFGVVVAKIERLLEQQKELSAAEICSELNMTRNQIGAVISRMRKASPKMPQRIYRVRYVFDHEGQRRYPRAVYALGDLPDAKKPVSSYKEIRKRYEKNKKMKINSVFQLGFTRRQMQNFNKGLI